MIHSKTARRRLRRRRIAGLATSALAVAGMGAAASAAKGDRASAIWVDTTSLRSSDGSLQVGDSLRFGFTTNYWDAAGGTGPWLHLQCVRDGEGWEGQLDGVLILADSRAGFSGGAGADESFVLAGTSWTKGPANCSGILGHRARNGRFVVEATTNFAVSG